jgi:nicotinic acid mononucleotide adenylyltransferase
MSLTDHAVRLARLHESPGYSADRFDPGAPLGSRVAVLPSAFNPPTRAHLALLRLAADLADVDSTATLLTTNNVDKAVFGAPLSHRIGMLLALREVEPVAVLGSNAARISDQGEALSIAFPGTSFDFVVGYDTLVRLFDERYYEDMPTTLDRFFGRHRLIAANRAQATVDALADFLRQPHIRPYADGVILRELDHAHLHISSTHARTAASRGEPTEALHEPVLEYIRSHGLYGEE